MIRLHPRAPSSLRATCPFSAMGACSVVVRISILWLLCIVEIVPAHAATLNTAELSAQIERGMDIYHRGVSTRETLIAELSAQNVRVPAATMPCVNCHGRDGRGIEEGGIKPGDLRWTVLTNQLTREGGSQRPAYDKRTLVRAITMGIDAAGIPLGAMMPRYRLRYDDAVDLVAYLRNLNQERDPGVSATVLRVATLLPAGHSGPIAAIERVLRSAIDKVNASGGVYGRQLELHVQKWHGNREGALAALHSLLSESAPFALLAPVVVGVGIEDAIADIVAAERIPLLTPFAMHAPVQQPPNQYVFYLLPGLIERARAVIEYLSRQPPRSTALLSADADSAVYRAVVDQLRHASVDGVAALPLHSSELATAIEGARRLILVGNEGDLRELLATLRRSRAWSQNADRELWVLGPASDGLLQATIDPTTPSIFTGLPLLPPPPEHWRDIAAEYALTPQHRQVQIATLATVRVFVEALRRQGRALDRAGFVATLEDVRGYRTGLLPVLRFTRNQRVGAVGAFIASVDPATHRLVPLSGWIVPRRGPTVPP